MQTAFLLINGADNFLRTPSIKLANVSINPPTFVHIDSGPDLTN